LSSFKRDFQKQYNESPGKWLLNKRLEYSSVLIRNNNMSISQIVFESGFEDISHFSRSFKTKFGISPTQFRQQSQSLPELLNQNFEP
jgi:AraC-like DNA-binding protein